MSSGSSRWTGPGRSSCATRKPRARSSGSIAALTICRAILVSGFMVATMSTIWNRACLRLMIAFLAGDHDHRHGAEHGHRPRRS